MKNILFAGAALLFISGAAQASVIPTLTSVTPSGVNETWTYQATLAMDQGLKTGSRFVIYDFAGYVPGTVFSPFAQWLASAENLTSGLVTLPGFVDDASLANLVFTYNGPEYRTSGGPYPSTDYNGFTAKSIFHLQTNGVFAAQAVKNNPDGAPGGSGTDTFNTGHVTTPIGPGVPEPATWAVMLMGFGLIGVTLRRRRQAFAV